MIKTITAAPVERDSHGFWTHPDYFVPANGNEFGVEGEFDAWKALNRVVGTLDWMDCDDNAEELQAAYDAGDCDLSMWQPTPPAGDGWFMASIHDTEDGPVCYWLRPIECDPKALAAHFDNCYAEAFKTEHLVAERDSALNACSLIADALGIKGAVAGDTIAKVQQLVAENVAAIEAVRIFSNATEQLTEIIGDEIGMDGVSLLLHGFSIVGSMPATTQALNEIKAQGVDDWIASRNGRWNGTTKEAEKFAASLRGE
ncbi:hypothetical protein LH413_16500 [Yersinia massiliensis]|uniref:hypothetical protein n=1 Tax=Yersinia massiliensis TaxID=419257 RepID=UPI001CFD5F3E|nr:hypothetical protein [Yersinia massiliensis]MCB5319096.1 hypothetical protein [Yersinia massiliensis]